MSRRFSDAPTARAAHALVTELQAELVNTLTAASERAGFPSVLTPVAWQRDEGRHGGGVRFQCTGDEALDRASVNVSHVHYDDDPDRRLGSATALSAIVHPRHPRAPSVHLHTSYTALRGGRATWRIMADLNPSHPHEGDRATFEAALRAGAGDTFERGRADGDQYFAIPALGRQRGVCHFYLEGLDTGDPARDRGLAETVERSVIDAYGRILERAWADRRPPTAAEQATQLAYHTLYCFQVLTLDRGTTSGLLVHGDNDLGILASLPSHLSRSRLASWARRAPAPQGALVDALVGVLAEGADRAAITDEVKRAWADRVRAHYAAHPEALALQASGSVVPPTVQNHGPLA